MGLAPPPAATIVVQKYGGSSVADLERLGLVADKVVAARRLGHRVVVVVSAMGKTTDALLAQARLVDPDPPRRELDMLVSTGERVSMALLSIALQRRGCDAISFTGSQAGILTTDRHFDARIIAVRPHRVEEELAKGRVVIVAGYQGVSERREVTTLGRGGSDTTAVALAAALNAERCEIYSDVDGVYSADPRVVADARHLAEIDCDTLQIAAESGAKVLNAQAVEWAKRAGITLYARHAGQTYDGGGAVDGSRQTLVHGGRPSRDPDEAGVRRPRVATIVGERGLALVHVSTDGAEALLGEEPEDVARASGVRSSKAPEAVAAPRELFVDGNGSATAIYSLLNAPDWARTRGRLEAAVGNGSVREGVGAVTIVGDGLTRGDGASSNRAWLRATRALRAPLHAVLVTPLRVTIFTDEANVDDLVRALHERLFAS